MSGGKGKATSQIEDDEEKVKRTRRNGEEEQQQQQQRNNTSESNITKPKEETYAQPVKPISIWQAPQSLLHPTSPPSKQVSQARKETYFRRVAMPERYEGPPPAKWQRRSQVVGGIFSVVIGVYIIFFHDYGPREHVFSPIRRMAGTNSFSIFQLSKQEKTWAEQRQSMLKNNDQKDGKERMV